MVYDWHWKNPSAPIGSAWEAARALVAAGSRDRLDANRGRGRELGQVSAN